MLPLSCSSRNPEDYRVIESLYSENNITDGVLNQKALTEFSNRVLTTSSLNNLFQSAMLLVVYLPSFETEKVGLFNTIIEEFDLNSRVLDLCFKYSPEILVIVSEKYNVESLESFVKRLKCFAARLELDIKLLSGQVSNHETLLVAVTRLVSTMRTIYK